jgi:hypothetical protein
MPEGWALKAAADFWEASQTPRSSLQFPRNIARAVPWALPVSIVRVGGLRVAALQQRIATLGLPPLAASSGRRLHGCLVAHRGSGLIYVDESDSEDEQRYTVAHEVGHFIADYLEPRRHALETIGPAALEVLDGTRQASLSERLRAVIAGDRLVAFVDLMGREESAPDAESRADRLAVELLAPEEAAEAQLAADPDADPALVLHAAFGLPPAVARSYARWLRPPIAALPGDWVLDRVRRRLTDQREAGTVGQSGKCAASCRTSVRAPEECG